MAQPDTVWTRLLSPAAFNYNMEFIHTRDGGFAFCGAISPQIEGRRDADFCLTKTDSLGRWEWNGRYEGFPNGRHQADDAKGMRQLADGGYVLVGDGGGGAIGMIVRTDSIGESIWTRYYYDDYRLYGFSDCELAEDDHIVVVSDDRAAEIDGEGEVVWHRRYGGEGNERFWTLTRCSDGGYLLVGETTSMGEGWADFYAVKIDHEGEVEWERAYGTEDNDVCGAVVETSDGGYCLAGSSRFAPGSDGIYAMVVRINIDGELIWQLVYDEFDPGGHLDDIVQTSDGGFAIAGVDWSQNGFYLLRVDAEGDVLWRTFYGDDPMDWCFSLILMEDGGYFLGGIGNRGAKLVRTEPDPLYDAGVRLPDPTVPTRFNLTSIYPNPFNDHVTLTFALPEQAVVELKVYDVTGRMVDTIVHRSFDAGRHTASWHGSDYSAGLYLVKFEAGDAVQTRKMVLVK